MLIPKKNRKEVYKYLFRGACREDVVSGPTCAPAFPSRWRSSAGFSPADRPFADPIPIALSTAEGVIYAKKDFNLPAHPEIKEVPNLQVRLSRGHDTDDPIVPNPKLQGHSRAACPLSP